MTNVKNAMNHLHTTRNGTLIPIPQLSDAHLANILKLIEKKARMGVRVEDAKVYGEEALTRMNYQAYVEEWQKRKHK